VFSGAVSVNVGSTVTINLPGVGQFYLLGSPIPYSGAVTNGSSLAAGINLNGLSDGSLVETFSSVSQSYTIETYDTTQAPLGPWFDVNDAIPQPVPTVTVGGGFFVSPGSAPYTWIQKLPFSP
jgi:hypothetical protein